MKRRLGTFENARDARVLLEELSEAKMPTAELRAKRDDSNEIAY